jgi:hypothetical protein
VQRDVALLVRGAGIVSADLARSFGAAWSCELIGMDAVRVSNGLAVDVRWKLEREFDPDEALPPGALSSPWRDDELAADAVAAVADAVQHAIQPVVGVWPWCAAHGTPLWADGPMWMCPVHADVAEVGQLPRTQPWTGGGELLS